MDTRMIPVTSSNIDGYQYISAQQVFLLAFRSGDVYRYDGVDEAEVQGFLAAGSKGSYFAQHIRNSYAFEKLDAVQLDDLLQSMAPSSLSSLLRKPVSETFQVLRTRYPSMDLFF